MRLSALLTETLIFVPGVLWFASLWFLSPTSWVERHSWILLVLIHPTLLIIDHGHFQYNSAMLGFALLAFAAFINRRYTLGSLFFCLSLTFKQMALFYALPVFFFLLGKCIQLGWKQGFALLVKLGATVVLTFAACILSVAQTWEDVVQVFVRVFPIQRGLYEDKVANFWCALSVGIKLRNLFTLLDLVKLSIAVTLLAVLPSGLLLLWRPDRRAFIYALLNSSLGFFLFSFQVHEKSILLPALPAALLLMDDPIAASWFMNVAMFSMFPLLKRDGLVLAYIAIVGIWNLLNPALARKSHWALRLAVLASFASMVSWHLGESLMPPPARYPDLFVVLNVLISAAHFVLFLAYFNLQQWWSSPPIMPLSPRSPRTSFFGSLPSLSANPPKSKVE
ncbi:glycosyl transferase [Entophlyctis helioformis]|nr:glycosyl transferase [Entophlyctis helioformis]